MENAAPQPKPPFPWKVQTAILLAGAVSGGMIYAFALHPSMRAPDQRWAQLQLAFAIFPWVTTAVHVTVTSVVFLISKRARSYPALTHILSATTTVAACALVLLLQVVLQFVQSEGRPPG